MMMTLYRHNSYCLDNCADNIFTKTSLMKPSPVPGQASPTPKEARNARRARSDRGDDDVQAPPPDTCRSYSPTRQVSVVGGPARLLRPPIGRSRTSPRPLARCAAVFLVWRRQRVGQRKAGSFVTLRAVTGREAPAYRERGRGSMLGSRKVERSMLWIAHRP